jgi:chromate transporter
VFALSWLYVLHGTTPVVAALFMGVKAAVLGFIIDALVRIGRRALKASADLVIAAASFAALYLFAAPFPLVILGAAAFGAVALRAETPDAPETSTQAQPSAGKTLLTVASWAALWLAPVVLLLLTLGPRHMLTQVSLLFSQLAVVTFGGAYAVLAYLQQQAVEVHAWITPGQMIDGLGLAETTPGPLILVNQFVGFLAGWQGEGGGFSLALAAAALASWCTFAPSFVWIFAGAPYAEHLRRSRAAAAALRGVTAAVLGVIASLALWFGLHVLFAMHSEITTVWGRTLVLPRLETFQWATGAIAAVATIALMRLSANAALVVLASAAAGWTAFAFL